MNDKEAEEFRFWRRFESGVVYMEALSARCLAWADMALLHLERETDKPGDPEEKL